MGKIKIIAFLILALIIYKIFISVKNFETNLDKQVAEIEKMDFEKEDEVIGLMMYLGEEGNLELVEHLLVRSRTKCFEMKATAEEYSNAYHEALNGMVERRMVQAISKTGSYWYTAWVNAGQPNLDFLYKKESSNSLKKQSKKVLINY